MIIAFLSAGLFNGLASASGLSLREKDIIRLEFINKQIQIIENDLRLYYMARPGDWPAVEPEENISSLRKLNQDLEVLELSPELVMLKPALKAVVDRLLKNCDGILAKDGKTREKEFQEFHDRIRDYQDQLAAKAERYLDIPVMDSFDLQKEEIKLFSDARDRESFNQALFCIYNRDYQECVNILNALFLKYKAQPPEGSILVRIVYCYMIMDSPLGGGAGEEQVLELLDEFIRRKTYSPVSHTAFLQWRTLDQMRNHGASNWSVIPNDEYNRVLWELIEMNQEYVERHPDDLWARRQLIGFLSTPVIGRFTGGFGNSVINDFARLNNLFIQKEPSDPEPTEAERR